MQFSHPFRPSIMILHYSRQAIQSAKARAPAMIPAPAISLFAPLDGELDGAAGCVGAGGLKVDSAALPVPEPDPVIVAVPLMPTAPVPVGRAKPLDGAAVDADDVGMPPTATLKLAQAMRVLLFK
jgi:hypothetical protein